MEAITLILSYVFSDKGNGKFSMDPKKHGAYKTAVTCIRLCEINLNKLIQDGCNDNFTYNKVQFDNPKTFDFNQDIMETFNSLELAGDNNEQCTRHIKEKIETYIIKTMLIEFEKLEIIIIFSAFFHRDHKHIIDLFYKNEIGAERSMRTPKEFSVIMSCGFMALYYKVVFIFKRTHFNLQLLRHYLFLTNLSYMSVDLFKIDSKNPKSSRC